MVMIILGVLKIIYTLPYRLIMNKFPYLFKWPFEKSQCNVFAVTSLNHCSKTKHDSMMYTLSGNVKI